MTPFSRGPALLGMLAALSGCAGFRTKTIRGDGLPGVVAAAQRDARSSTMAPDPNGEPLFVETGFHAVEVRDNKGGVEVFRVPVGASFEGPNLLVQTYNQTRRYTPKDVDVVRLRYERAEWSRTLGTVAAVLGAATSLTGFGLSLFGFGGDAASTERGLAGLGMGLGGLALNITGVVIFFAGPDEPPPVWQPPAASPHLR